MGNGSYLSWRDKLLVIYSIISVICLYILLRLGFKYLGEQGFDFGLSIPMLSFVLNPNVSNEFAAWMLGPVMLFYFSSGYGVFCLPLLAFRICRRFGIEIFKFGKQVDIDNIRPSSWHNSLGKRAA